MQMPSHVALADFWPGRAACRGFLTCGRAVKMDSKGKPRELEAESGLKGGRGMGLVCVGEERMVWRRGQKSID